MTEGMISATDDVDTPYESIGRPVGNTVIKLVDSENKECGRNQVTSSQALNLSIITTKCISIRLKKTKPLETNVLVQFLVSWLVPDVPFLLTKPSYFFSLAARRTSVEDAICV